jgi:hypothetical protein
MFNKFKSFVSINLYFKNIILNIDVIKCFSKLSKKIGRLVIINILLSH